MNLKSILGIEFIKLRKPANYILLGLLLLLFVLIAVVGLKMSISVEPPSNETTFNQVGSFGLSISKLLVTLFIIINIAGEYTDRSLRKSVIDGQLREDFYKGKFILLLLVSLFVFVLNVLNLLFESGLSGHLNETFALFTPAFLIDSFLRIVFAGIWGFFLVFITQSVAISLVIYFVWGVVESLLIMIPQLTGSNINLSKYLPIAGLEHAFAANSVIPVYSLILPMVYIFLMLFGSYFLLIKRDIK